MTSEGRRFNDLAGPRPPKSLPPRQRLSGHELVGRARARTRIKAACEPLVRVAGDVRARRREGAAPVDVPAVDPRQSIGHPAGRSHALDPPGSAIVSALPRHSLLGRTATI